VATRASVAPTNRTAMVYAEVTTACCTGFDASNGSEKLAFVRTKSREAEQIDQPRLWPAICRATSILRGRFTHRGRCLWGFWHSCPSTSPCWRSILISGLRKGGQGFFALDVTDPSTFSESNAAKQVLWESPTLTIRTWGTPSVSRRRQNGQRSLGRCVWQRL